ncbi:hypothetical protein [Paraburkholderia sp. J8-2]|uniref:hypothetical protein n=1 Tax=Paraburkholderia sp. J8-2 TaxID=2805440 RepID=UPI002AB73FBE|nr:hypothetical protein [Paraburkholderia sp. J8-2]
MFSVNPQASSETRAHSWHDTATYLITVAFRFCILLLALWSVRFTIERQHAWVGVDDYHQCAPSMGLNGISFASGCEYSDVSVSPSLLHQTYQITAPDGSRTQTRFDEPIVGNGSIGVEHRTVGTWLLYAIAAFALAPTLCLSLLASAGLRMPPRLMLRQRARFAAMALIALAALLIFAPTLRETLALHRIESSELDARFMDLTTFATVVQTSTGGDLLLLGTDNYDRSVRVAGYGCHLYTERGEPIARNAFGGAATVKRSALPNDTRFVGHCLYPHYNHALGTV